MDDERDREEKKKKKKAAKRRDKNKRKKNVKDGDTLDAKLNGVIQNHIGEFDELDEEETKGRESSQTEDPKIHFILEVYQFSVKAEEIGIFIYYRITTTK